VRIVPFQKSPSISIVNLSLFFCLISGFIFIPTANAADCATAGTGDSIVSQSCNNLVITGAGNVTINSNVTINFDGIQGYYDAVSNFDITNSLINEGVISGYYTGILLQADSSIGALTNSRAISSELGNGIELYPRASITTFTNTGTILGLGNMGIYNNGGSQEVVFTDHPDPSAIGTIGTLNNLQGGDAPLTFFGKVPTNYNVMISDQSHYGKFELSAALGSSGTMTFSVSPTSNLTTNTYSAVLSNVNSAMLNPGSFEGSLGQASWILQENGSSNIWDLSVTGEFIYISGPTAADTQASLNTQARRLRSTFNSTMASGNFANMNAYDCNLFDQNNMCISAGGRITTIDNPSSHHSAAVVVLGYKVNSNIRIGGFLDQSVNHNMPTGVDMSNKNPMMGAFAVWNHQADGLGFQMKLANAYLDKDVTTSRAVIGTSEAGRGRTDLNTQSYVGELSYAFNYQDSTIVRPYFALRYTNIKQDAYTEDTSASVTAPLTYAKLSDRSTSALMGVKVNHALTPKTNLTASLGVEQDIHHKTDQLTASGVADLTSENFNNNIKRTRPVASAGAYYAVAKNQRLSGEVYYQQLPFQSTGSATAYVNYMIGF
jgi:hypothetical protein